MPIAGCNSAAIAAACHAREQVDTRAPLMWGVTVGEEGQVEGEGEEDRVGHCAFSDRKVSMPVKGRLYQGFRRRTE
jgi:hypothetical protein